MTEFGPPGVKSTRAWVEHDQCGMGNPPGVLARLGEVLGGARKDSGGSARWSSPA